MKNNLKVFIIKFHMPKKQTKEEFIVKAKKIHGDKFDYTLVEYVNSKTKVKIVCPEHGIFKQSPNDHLSGYGCRDCQYIKTSKLNKFTNETFKMKANEQHNNQYDYSLVDYNGYENKVKIVCPEHGDFKQTPHLHLSGAGCQLCKESHGEKRISKLLTEKKINFERQVSFNDLIGDLKPLVYDFYLPEHKILIEYDGIQHSRPIKFFGGNDRFIKQKKYDRKKIDYVINNGFKLLKLSHITFPYLEEALDCELKNNNLLC